MNDRPDTICRKSLWTDLCHAMRASPRAIICGVGASFAGGIFPDAISHGIILAERTGHHALFIIGISFIAVGLFWLGVSRTLYSRYDIITSRTMEVVE